MRHHQRPRILLYSHDTYGLGHLRRSLLLAGRLAASEDGPTVLIASGSPRAMAFPLPQGCDVVKLPSVTKGPGGRYRARTMSMPLREMLELRAELLRAVATSFRPDLVLVDHAPVGAEGELLPLFAGLPRRGHPGRPRMVLGLRDVVDDALRVRLEWDRLGAWDVLEDVYDLVLVYGDPRVPTTAQDLGLERRWPDRIRFTGYLGRPIARTRAAEDGRPTILVTAGGGGDGHALLRAYAALLASIPGPRPFRSVVLTGPFLSRRRRRELDGAFRAAGDVEVLAFSDAADTLLASADGVVAMGGYNTVVEVLSARVPALLVPRSAPRREQVLRVERLAPVTGVETCLPEDLDPSRLGGFVERVVGGRARRPSGVDLGGLDRAAASALGLLHEGSGVAAARAAAWA